MVANVPSRLRIENLNLRQLEQHQAEPSDPFVLCVCSPTTSFQTPLYRRRCAGQSRLREPRNVPERASRAVRQDISDRRFDGTGLSWFLLVKGGIMTTIESTSRVLDQPRAQVTLGEDQFAAVAFLARYRDPGGLPPRLAQPVPVGGRSRPGRPGGHPHPPGAVPDFDGRTRPGGVDHRPACPRPAVSTASRTSTAASPPIRPSMSAAPRFARLSAGAWTAASWPASCIPRSASSTPTPLWPCCSASTGCGSLRRAMPTWRTWAWSGEEHLLVCREMSRRS